MFSKTDCVDLQKKKKERMSGSHQIMPFGSEDEAQTT